MASRLFKHKSKYRPPVIRKQIGKRLAEVGKRLLTLLSMLVIFTLLGAIGWSVYRFAFYSPFFQMREINISTLPNDEDQSTRSDNKEFLIIREQILVMLKNESISEGNLLRVETNKVRKVVESHSKVRKAKVQKFPPNRMEIDIELRQPVAIIAANDILAIDQEGVIIGNYATYEDIVTQHPFITGLELPDETPGSQIESESLTKALLLLSSVSVGIPSLANKISECHCGNQNELTLVLAGGTEIRFGTDNPLSRMPALETFLIGLQVPLEQYAYVDLRTEGLVYFRPKAGVAQSMNDLNRNGVSYNTP